MFAIINELETYCLENDVTFGCEETLVGEETIDGVNVVHIINTSLDIETINEVIQDLRRWGFGAYSCNHPGDCCGCLFLSSVRVLGKTPFPIIHESWGRNV